MKKREIAVQVAAETGLAGRDSRAAVNAVFGCIRAALLRGEAVQVAHFGMFLVSTRAAGAGRDFRTGARVPILPTGRAVFRAGGFLSSSAFANWRRFPVSNWQKQISVQKWCRGSAFIQAAGFPARFEIRRAPATRKSASASGPWLNVLPPEPDAPAGAVSDLPGHPGPSTQRPREETSGTGWGQEEKENVGNAALTGIGLEVGMRKKGFLIGSRSRSPERR